MSPLFLGLVTLFLAIFPLSMLVVEMTRRKDIRSSVKAWSYSIASIILITGAFATTFSEDGSVGIIFIAFGLVSFIIGLFTRRRIW